MIYAFTGFVVLGALSMVIFIWAAIGEMVMIVSDRLDAVEPVVGTERVVARALWPLIVALGAAVAVALGLYHVGRVVGRVVGIVGSLGVRVVQPRPKTSLPVAIIHRKDAS